MHLLFILSVILQFICLVHMVRSGRPYWWLWVIMLGSYLGVAVYFFTQILPELQRSPATRRVVRNVQKTINPERDRKRIAAELEVADTVTNRARLAEESMTLGDFVGAAQLYEGCLRGQHHTAPDLMSGLARAQFAASDFSAAKATLEALIAANPGFRSPEGHLLFARSLEALGDSTGALTEYAALAESFPGEEGRVRYALLLKRTGQLNEAHAVCKRVLQRVKVAPQYYQRENSEWIEQARANLPTDEKQS